MDQRSREALSQELQVCKGRLEKALVRLEESTKAYTELAEHLNGLNERIVGLEQLNFDLQGQLNQAEDRERAFRDHMNILSKEAERTISDAKELIGLASQEAAIFARVFTLARTLAGGSYFPGIIALQEALEKGKH